MPGKVRKGNPLVLGYVSWTGRLAPLIGHAESLGRFVKFKNVAGINPSYFPNVFEGTFNFGIQTGRFYVNKTAGNLGQSVD